MAASEAEDPELTRHERELLLAPGIVRGGYAPRDGVAEPSQAPPGPAGVSAAPTDPPRARNDDTPAPAAGEESPAP